MAGGWSRRVCRPAPASIISSPPMMLAVHARDTQQTAGWRRDGTRPDLRLDHRDVWEFLERDLAAADGGAQAFQGNARCRQAPHEPAQLIDAEAAPLGCFSQLVSLHEPYC